MRILLIHNYYRYRGGEDRYVDILEKNLKSRGHHVARFFFHSRDISGFNFFQKIMIPLRLLNSPSTNKYLEKLIAEQKPDLAVVHNLFPLLSLNLLKVLKRKGIPVLKRLENYKFLCLNGLFLRNDFTVCERCKYGNFFPGIIYRCYQGSFSSSLGIAISEFVHRRLRTAIKWSDLFLATSQFVKGKFVEAGFPQDKIVVQPNFIDFQPLNAAVPPGNYAVYLGRLSKEKGLLTLLEAFKELPDLPLKVLGEGPMEEELIEFARLHQMNNVSFEGFIDGEMKKEILKKALFLIFPSECYESFGYTIIESFACGVPVVASDIGGARELVTEGRTGFLFKAGCPKDLHEKILHLTANRQLLLDMKELALERAKSQYTLETGFQELFRLFQQLTGK